MEKKRVWTRGKADFMLMLVTMAWGSSYLMMQLGLGDMQPCNLIALRFGIAFLAVFPFFFTRLKTFTRREIGVSALLGVLLCIGFSCLMHGLLLTTASNAAFLEASAVVLVPVFHAGITRKLPERPLILGALVTMTGISFLSLGSDLMFHAGDLLCLGSAVCYAFRILITDRASREMNPLHIGAGQLGFASLFALIACFLTETPRLPGTPAAFAAVLGLALLCSAFGLIMQSVAQQFTTAEDTSLIFSLEPVFSAIFAFLFAGELLSPRELFGAGLVLAGVILPQIRPGKRLSRAKGFPFRKPGAVRATG